MIVDPASTISPCDGESEIEAVLLPPQTFSRPFMAPVCRGKNSNMDCGQLHWSDLSGMAKQYCSGLVCMAIHRFDLGVRSNPMQAACRSM